MLGIDVSKDTLVATLVDPTTREARWTKSFPNTLAGVSRLLAQTPESSTWVLEPTGRYSLLAVRQAQAAGRTVWVADPKEARHYLKSRHARAKTDRLDSFGLALFALDRPLRPYPLKTAPLEKVDQLLSARRGIVDAASRLGQQLKELPHAADPLQEAISALKKQQRQLERQIEQLTGEEPELAAAIELQQVPGIGLITAAAVASRLAAHSFRHPDHWVAYVGLDIRVHESGKHKGQCGLTKHGDAELRRLLFLCARASVRAKDSPFTAQYEREVKKGMKEPAAICAVARKLARVAWSLCRHGSQYDRERVYQQPQATTA